MQRRQAGGCGDGAAGRSAASSSAAAVSAVADQAAQYEKLVKQHFVALQALENVAWENERLQDEVEAAQPLRRRVTELEAAAREAATRHAVELRAAAEAGELAALQAKLESDVIRSRELEEAATEHRGGLRVQQEQSEALRKAAKAGFDEALAHLERRLREEQRTVQQLREEAAAAQSAGSPADEATVSATRRLQALLDEAQEQHRAQLAAVRQERDRLAVEATALRAELETRAAATQPRKGIPPGGRQTHSNVAAVFRRSAPPPRQPVGKAPLGAKQRPASGEGTNSVRGGTAMGAMSLKVEHLQAQAKLAEGRYQDVLKQNRQLKQLLLNNRETQRKLVGRKLQ